MPTTLREAKKQIANTHSNERKNREKIYGNRIKAILHNKQMTPQELSDLAGIDPSHLSRIINGKKRCISLPVAFKVSRALRTPIEEVFIYKKPMSFDEDDNN